MSPAATDSLVRAALRDLTAYAPPEGDAAIRLDANECPWPLPDEAREIVANAIVALDLHRYPDAAARELRRAIAQRVGGEARDILVGAGSDEVIAILITALSEPRAGRTRPAILYPTPTFVMYRVTATAHGVDRVEVPLDAGFALDADAMQKAIAEHHPNLIFLATPNNPTGNVFDEVAVRRVIEADPGVLVVVDEAYGAYAGRTLAGLCDEYGNVALLGTVSKVGLAGIRVGYCRLPASLSGAVDKARQPYNLSSLAQAVGLLGLEELAPVLQHNVERVVAERERLSTALAAMPGFTPHPSAANFILVSVAADAAGIGRALAERGIRVKVFSGAQPLENHLRITVGTPPENDALLAALHA